MALSLSITTLQTELDALNLAITTYLSTGVLPASYSLPTGHSADTKDTLSILYARRKELIELANTIDVPYVTSVQG